MNRAGGRLQRDRSRRVQDPVPFIPPQGAERAARLHVLAERQPRDPVGDQPRPGLAPPERLAVLAAADLGEILYQRAPGGRLQYAADRMRTAVGNRLGTDDVSF